MKERLGLVDHEHEFYIMERKDDAQQPVNATFQSKFVVQATHELTVRRILEYKLFCNLPPRTY